jgi:accessory gene regulator protein AgrB
MKFCPVVPEIYREQVHVPKKERRKRRKRIIRIIIIIIIIIIRNGAKTISRCLGDLINHQR